MSARLSTDPHLWPPSAQDIVRHIDRAGPLTNKDLVERTGMARRTLGRTLGRLVAAGYVDRRPSLQDTRRFYYFLDEAAPRPSW